jgi:hypothetical protein
MAPALPLPQCLLQLPHFLWLPRLLCLPISFASLLPLASHFLHLLTFSAFPTSPGSRTSFASPLPLPPYFLCFPASFGSRPSSAALPPSAHSLALAPPLALPPHFLCLLAFSAFSASSRSMLPQPLRLLWLARLFCVLASSGSTLPLLLCFLALPHVFWLPRFLYHSASSSSLASSGSPACSAFPLPPPPSFL